MVKRSKIIDQQLKTIDNPNIINTKTVTAEHPKTLHKLFKIAKQVNKLALEKILSDSTFKKKQTKIKKLKLFQ